MIPGQFEYVRPGSLDEALRILRDREGEAKILSGGYSLIPLIKLRLAQPALLVDIQAITGLDGITEAEDGLHIGSRATHRQIHEHPIVVDRYPLHPRRRRAASATRRSATGARSAARSRTRTRHPTGRRALLALNATIVCRGADGDREIAARDFFIDTFTTAIEPTEVLAEVRISSARGARAAPTRSSSAGSATSRRPASRR